MTLSQLHREVADLHEKVEELQAENATLKAELMATKTQLPEERQEMQWFDTPAAAAYIGRSCAFLNKDRLLPEPVIPFRKDSTRVVRYHRSDLDEYNEARRAKKKARS